MCLTFIFVIGAVYCDVTLLKSGMYGEGMTSGSVIAVKTHRLSPEWTTPDTPKSKVLWLYLTTTA